MKAGIGTDVAKAAAYLKAGEVVAIPTETVYGLAGDAFNTDAVLQIFHIKNRPSFDPLIVHVGNTDTVNKVAQHVPEAAHLLMQAFWPGPLTIILEKHPEVPDIVTSGLNTVGVRMPRHPLTLELLQILDFPLAAPSANPFGYISPTTAAHVADQLGNKIPYVLDGGQCTVGIESTIVGFRENKCLIYRYGGISADQIQTVTSLQTVAAINEEVVNAPGMMENHYSPAKPFYLGNLKSLLQLHGSTSPAVISFRKPDFDLPAGTELAVLSESGNLDEAARNLFAYMRQFDQRPVNAILAEEVPDEGIGKAINDRMKRAAAKR